MKTKQFLAAMLCIAGLVSCSEQLNQADLAAKRSTQSVTSTQHFYVDNTLATSTQAQALAALQAELVYESAADSLLGLATITPIHSADIIVGLEYLLFTKDTAAYISDFISPTDSIGLPDILYYEITLPNGTHALVSASSASQRVISIAKEDDSENFWMTGSSDSLYQSIMDKIDNMPSYWIDKEVGRKLEMLHDVALDLDCNSGKTLEWEYGSYLNVNSDSISPLSAPRRIVSASQIDETALQNWHQSAPYNALLDGEDVSSATLTATKALKMMGQESINNIPLDNDINHIAACIKEVDLMLKNGQTISLHEDPKGVLTEQGYGLEAVLPDFLTWETRMQTLENYYRHQGKVVFIRNKVTQEEGLVTGLKREKNDCGRRYYTVAYNMNKENQSDCGTQELTSWLEGKNYEFYVVLDDETIIFSNSETE